MEFSRRKSLLKNEIAKCERRGAELKSIAGIEDAEVLEKLGT
jgi:hypothetical protein